MSDSGVEEPKRRPLVTEVHPASTDPRRKDTRGFDQALGREPAPSKRPRELDVETMIRAIKYGGDRDPTPGQLFNLVTTLLGESSLFSNRKPGQKDFSADEIMDLERSLIRLYEGGMVVMKQGASAGQESSLDRDIDSISLQGGEHAIDGYEDDLEDLKRFRERLRTVIEGPTYGGRLAKPEWEQRVGRLGGWLETGSDRETGEARDAGQTYGELQALIIGTGNVPVQIFGESQS